MSTEGYRWEEKEWFEERKLPGYTDSDEAELRTEFGEGDDWGGAHEFRTGTEKEEWLAFDILRQTGRLLCATTLFDAPDHGVEPLFAWLFDDDGELVEAHDPSAMHHKNAEVELSEPELCVPDAAPESWGTVDYGQQRHRRRLNDETGYISGGASTGCIVADRPHGEFMHVIETILPLTSLPPSQTREVRQWMSERKRQSDARDIDLLAEFLAVALTQQSSDGASA